MANKKQPLIIEQKDFKVFLAARMGVLGGDIAGLAEFLGVSQATAYQLLSGAAEPSAEVLKRAGLRSVYVMDVNMPDPQEDQAPAEKPKRIKR
jgi:transcriptional regulator with XRE-family HTH domain